MNLKKIHDMLKIESRETLSRHLNAIEDVFRVASYFSCFFVIFFGPILMLITTKNWWWIISYLVSPVAGAFIFVFFGAFNVLVEEIYVKIRDPKSKTKK